MRYARVFSVLVLASAAGPFLSAQAVVSAHAGIINFFEGSAFLDDQAVTSQAGTFASIKNNQVFRTEKGRAEILLMPGVFLRIDENSAVRMLSDSLTDTRVEFLRGSAILDSNDATGKAPVTLTFKTYQLRFSKPGVYRIDSEPAVFETYTGEAQILADGQPPKTIDESRQFFFGIGVDTSKMGDGAVDEFSEWARSRAETITADNQAAQQSAQLPPDPDPGAYAPFSGTLPNVQPSIPSYGVVTPPVFIDSYAGVYSPVFNPWFGIPSPITVIYVVPRNWLRRYPSNGISPVHKPIGYPRLDTAATSLGYTNSAFSHPGLTPLHSTYMRPSSPLYARPTSVRPIVAPRSYAAPRVSSPRISAPPVMHAPAIGAHH